MTGLAQSPVGLLLTAMADELVAVRSMLLSVEGQIGTASVSPETAAVRGLLQGFDLSLQVLQDVERLARQIAESISAGLVVTLNTESLQLERTRARFALPPGTPPPEQASDRRIDLFHP